MASASNQSVTLKNIAERTGVSRNTVSRVLNSQADYARPTFAKRAQHIREVAMEMGYRPNVAARATRNGRFGNITLMISKEGRGLFLPPGLIRQLELACGRVDSRLMISEAPDAHMTDPAQAPRVFQELATDGLLINYCGKVPAIMGRLLERFAIPTVWINDKRDHDAVYPDDFEGGRRATRAMLELGHRRITYIDSGSAEHYSATDRQAGYVQAMAQAGLPPMVRTLSHDASEQLAQIGQLLDDAAPTTALIVNGPALLHTVGGAALVRRIKIGQDLSVSSFDITGEAPIAGGHVGCWYWPQDQAADRSVQMLGQKVRQPLELLPAQPIALRHGDLTLSCGRPRATSGALSRRPEVTEEAQ